MDQNDHRAGDPERRPEHLVAAIEAQVDLRPDHSALVGPEHTLTFAQVEATANAAAAGLAHRLADDTVTAGDDRAPVALLMAHDVDLVVALVAVMKAGRPVVVLDPEAPAEVSAAVLADSRTPILVHDAAHRDPASGLAGDALASWDDLVAVPAPRVAVDLTGDSLALLAYTSGTAGAPKAAAIPHGALVHLMRGATDALRITPDEHMPMLFPLSLAVAAYPMLLPLVNGATLHTFDLRGQGLAPFPAWLEEQGITLTYFSPTVARFLEGATEEIDFPRLRTVVLGGERVDADAVRVVRRVFGDHVVVVNGYGTTETGVLTFHTTVRGATYGSAGVPVGRAIEGMDLVLVDDRGERVADGEVGDLVVRSRQLFQGYWGRPDLDAAVLGVDPDSGVPTYRTGDLGRIRDGELELVGRSDTEVKVRGHRVVPGEVEHALLALDLVRDAVVEARPDAKGANELVAWVVTVGGATGAEVRGALAEVARPHLLPPHVLAVDELPLLPNGKLDRRSLPDPPRERPLELGPWVGPRDADEEMVLDAWEQVFTMRPIGVHDDFEALGGQSLDAAWILVVLESRHGVRLPMSDLVEARTVAALAERIRADRASGLLRRSHVTVLTPPVGERPTLYFVHDLHGTAYSLRHLAPLLGADQPLAGFESPFLDGNRAPFTSLETLALRYVSDLRRHQPEGPYLLAGYSFGGVLAFEMARQLVADGAEVPFLGVFDVGPGYRGRHYHPRRPPQKPTLHIPLVPDEVQTATEQVRWYGALARTSPLGVIDNLLVRTRLDRLTDATQVERDLRTTGTIHPARRLWYAWRTHWKLAATYSWEDKAYPGPLTLFWADESASTDATMGWGPLIGSGLEIVRVSVPHEEFLQEQGVAAIAGPLRAALDRTLARGEPLSRSPEAAPPEMPS